MIHIDGSDHDSRRERIIVDWLVVLTIANAALWALIWWDG